MNKYILLSLMLITFNLLSMQAPKSQKPNTVPTKVAQCIIDNPFFESNPGSNQTTLTEVLEKINWSNWTKEELNIICDILKSKTGRKNTSRILIYFYNLQFLYNSMGHIENNEENIDLTSKLAALRCIDLQSFNAILHPEINQ